MSGASSPVACGRRRRPRDVRTSADRGPRPRTARSSAAVEHPEQRRLVGLVVEAGTCSGPAGRGRPAGSRAPRCRTARDPRRARCPESIRSTGDWYAPADRITSCSARISSTPRRAGPRRRRRACPRRGAQRQRVGDHVEIRPRPLPGAGTRPPALPPPVALRDLEAADAVLACAVEVGVVVEARELGAASSIVSISGVIERLSETLSGPPTPWNASSPRRCPRSA